MYMPRSGQTFSHTYEEEERFRMSFISNVLWVNVKLELERAGGFQRAGRLKPLQVCGYGGGSTVGNGIPRDVSWQA